MTIFVPGYTTLIGHPVTILRVLRQCGYIAEADSDERYIQRVIRKVYDQSGIYLEDTGYTLTQRAEHLLKGLSESGKLVILED